jgi:plasmid maintenance system antidote protein VapI
MIGRDHTTFAEPLAHPGAHLREDFLPDYGLTAGALARAMGLQADHQLLLAQTVAMAFRP